MKKYIKSLFHTLFSWVFSEEVELMNATIRKTNEIRLVAEYQKKQMDAMVKKLEGTVGSIDVSIDVDDRQRSSSWAVVSVQGQRNFIKFVDLGNRDAEQIRRFLRNFEHQNIDAPPMATKFLRS